MRHSAYRSLPRGTAHRAPRTPPAARLPDRSPGERPAAPLPAVSRSRSARPYPWPAVTLTRMPGTQTPPKADAPEQKPAPGKPGTEPQRPQAPRQPGEDKPAERKPAAPEKPAAEGQQEPPEGDDTGGYTLADLPSVAKPAPGATPAGEVLRDAGGTMEAWLGGDGEQVGYLREAAEPDRVVAIADTSAWQQIVDGLGMTTGGEGAPVAAPGGKPGETRAAPGQQPGTEPDKKPAAGGDAGATGSRPAGDRMSTGKPDGTEGKAASLTDDEPDEDDAPQRRGIMIALMVGEGDAADMVLDHPRAEPAGDLHITLAYLGSTDDVEDEADRVTKILEVMTDVAEQYQPIVGQVNGLGRFHTLDGDALVLLYDSPWLSALRQDLIDALADEGIFPATDHGFTPHITLAYLTEGEEWPMNGVGVSHLEFPELTLAFGDARISTPLREGLTPDDVVWMDGVGMLADSTAPSVNGTKAKAKDGDNTAPKKGGPPVSSGAYVSWSGGKGRVDMVVTNGTVPGVEGDVTGTSSSPAARVVVYKQVDGAWKATGQKIGIAASKLKRTAPLRSTSGKSAAEELVTLLAEHNAAIETGDLPDHARVSPAAVRAVHDRGVKSYPGADRTPLTAEEWGTKRTAAFLQLAAGIAIPGYRADRDLLGGAHPMRREPVAGDDEEPSPTLSSFAPSETDSRGTPEEKASYQNHQHHGGWIWAGHPKGFRQGEGAHKYGPFQVSLFRRRGGKDPIDLNKVTWRDVDEEESPSNLLSTKQQASLLDHEETPLDLARAIEQDRPLSPDQMREAGDILGGNAQDYLYLQANASEHRHELAGIGDEWVEADDTVLNRRTPVTGRRQTPAQRAAVEYRAYLESRHDEADKATSGNMVNAVGRSKGITGRDFFDPESPGRIRYASEELLDWLRDNGPNLKPSQYRSQHDERLLAGAKELPAPAEILAELRAALAGES